MSTTTPNLGLFKYNTTADANVAFNINTALNANWDKIDTAMAGGGLPDQTDKAGYLLTTDGTNASWGETGEIYPIIETYVDGTSWYRVYSDGWCEQGGETTSMTGGSSQTITFLIPFNSNSYNILVSPLGAYTAVGEANSIVSNRNNNWFTCYSGQAASTKLSWIARGYIEV